MWLAGSHLSIVKAIARLHLKCNSDTPSPQYKLGLVGSLHMDFFSCMGIIRKVWVINFQHKPLASKICCYPLVNGQ